MAQPPPFRIACIGRAGQCARALIAHAEGDPEIDVVAAGRETANLTDPDALARFVDATEADCVINAGAYNLVDRAESEPDRARAVNSDGPAQLAAICRARGLPFIHMSTDYVFDGAKRGAYTEDDAVNPLSVYGRTKLEGEQRVLEADPDALVVRVSWVFSGLGDTFVARMIDLARRQTELRMVCDQISAPTYALDIARTLVAAAQQMAAAPGELSGILHVAGPDAMSRADMTSAILAESRRQGGPSAPVVPVSWRAFPAPAARPTYSVLSSARAMNALGFVATPFADAISASVRAVLDSQPQEVPRADDP